MIRGYFQPSGHLLRPYVSAILDFPSIGYQGFDVQFLVDTGADRTVLGHSAAQRLEDELGLDLSTLEIQSSRGTAGITKSRVIEARLTLATFSLALPVAILPSPPGEEPSVPSLLGQSVLDHLSLIHGKPAREVLFLDAEEYAALNLPSR